VDVRDVEVISGKKTLVFPVLKKANSCIACTSGGGNGEKYMSFRNEHCKNLKECLKRVISVAVL